MAGEAFGVGRAGTGPSSPAYGASCGNSVQSDDSLVLSAAVGRGQSQEGGVDGVYAEAPHNAQCNPQEWNTVAGGGEPARLIVKTVADSVYSAIALGSVIAKTSVPFDVRRREDFQSARQSGHECRWPLVR